MPPFTLPGDPSLTDIIYQPNSGLTGSIPSEIGTFKSLTSLDLNINNMTSSLPSQLGLLTELTHLNLAFNSFTGRLPSELGQLTSENMEFFKLTSNMLNSTIPSQLGLLNPTEFFSLGLNSFSGVIPSQLGAMTSLTGFEAGFELFYNRLEGSIPSQLGRLTGLYDACAYTPNSFCFTLNENRLCGKVPGQLAGMSDAMSNYFIELWAAYVDEGNPALYSACGETALPVTAPTPPPSPSPASLSAPHLTPTPARAPTQGGVELGLVLGLVGGAAGLLLLLLVGWRAFKSVRRVREFVRRKLGRQGDGDGGTDVELRWTGHHKKKKRGAGSVCVLEEDIYGDVPSFTSNSDGGWSQSEQARSTLSSLTTSTSRFSIGRYSDGRPIKESREEVLAPLALAPLLQANSSALMIPVDLLGLEKKPFAAGASGSLFKGTYNGVKVAAKMLYSHTGDKEREEFDREFRMLAMLRHPNIVALYGMSQNRATDHLYIVQEFVGGGDLHSLMGANGGANFTHGVMGSVVGELLGAVRYMHDSGIAHRDLKPMNLLVTEACSLRVCDLGLARNYQQSQITANVGTATYMPVEAFDDSLTNATGYDASCWDIYSLGVILFELWHRGHPWHELGTMKVFGNLMRAERPACGDSGSIATNALAQAATEALAREVAATQAAATKAAAIEAEELVGVGDDDGSTRPPWSSASSSSPSPSASAVSLAPPPPSSFGAPIPPALKSLIESCWAHEAKDRLPIKAVMELYVQGVKPELEALERRRLETTTPTVEAVTAEVTSAGCSVVASAAEAEAATTNTGSALSSTAL